jgi:Kef-type K+ transport system membrane component KefB
MGWPAIHREYNPMTPFLQLLLFLSIILFLAKLGGFLSSSLRQPSVLGELMVGLLLGPSLLNILHLPVFENPTIESIIESLAEIGVLMLMFVAGLELHMSELARNSKVSAFAGVLGVLLPVGLGWGVGMAFNFQSSHALFLGLTLGATSVSISAQTLIELKALRSRVGLGLLGAAVFDDVLVILLLSSFLALQVGGSGLVEVIWVLLRMAAFLILSILFGLYGLPRLSRLITPLPISQGIITLALIVMFLYGFAAELLGGMAAITGSFLAGLMFSRSPEKERLERGISALAYSFFVPIFFINIGLAVNVREMGKDALWLMLVVVFVAVVGKLFGAGFGARMAGFSWLESAQLGAGMVSRGEVGLILASVGLTEGLMTANEFSVVVGTVIISTIITPMLLRSLFSKEKTNTAVNIPT